MRRKLIQQEAFDELSNSSVRNAEFELAEAATVLSRAIGHDLTGLHGLTESTVIFKTGDDSYVHAGYRIKDDQIALNNIEELVVDHDSRKAKQRAVLGEMLDAVMLSQNDKAHEHFKQYMGLHSFNETRKFLVKSRGQGDFEAIGRDEKPRPKGKLKDKMTPEERRKSEETREKSREFKGSPLGRQHEDARKAFKDRLKAAGKKVEEAYNVALNVVEFADYLRVGPSLAEASTQADTNGNVVAVAVPTSHRRNEARIERSTWKTLNERVHGSRRQALSLAGDQNFVRAMVDLRRQNGISSNQGMSEVLENVAGAWPHLLYVTQNELAGMIGEALAVAGETRFDDDVCNFLAEGVLRTIHKAYAERANQVLHLASATPTGDDAYEHFQTTVEAFYPAVDEKFGLERKVFEDLYVSLETLYHTAARRGDEAVKSAAAGYLNEVSDVVEERSKPDIDLAEEVAGWIRDLIETNLGGGAWSVSNKAHVTVSGDHPDMEKKARQGYSPASDFDGGWGDPAPMVGQDDMKYKGGKFSKKARSDSWGNEENKDTFPKLKNPYVPEPFGDYTMKGEKGVDKDTYGQHGATWKSGDTWPKLQNPYVPKAETPKTYKMNHGKERDLVVGK